MSDQQPPAAVPPPEQPQGVPLGPVPVGFGVQAARDQNSGKKLILLTMQTPLGQQTYFVSPEGARMLGERLMSESTDLTLAKTMPQEPTSGR